VKSKYLIIGAGIHGLSTAWHLAAKLKSKNGGLKEDDVLVIDKTAVAAGASGTACGVVRNNYFQPAMRELMAHSVELWESDPKVFAYEAVGFMAISPESMKKNMQSVYEQQKTIGYESEFIEGEKQCSDYMKKIFSDWQAKGITNIFT
jgi:glycine/D-amino acid oxidase-like deaminating enzyme